MPLSCATADSLAQPIHIYFQKQHQQAAMPDHRATTSSWSDSDKVDISPTAVGSYKLFRPLNAERLITLFREARDTLQITRNTKNRARFHNASNAANEALLEASWPHLSLHGKPLEAHGLTPEHILFYCSILLPGGYFPSVHWDTDWLMFPNAAGFQMWFYLKEFSVDPDEGSMYMVSTPDLQGVPPYDMPNRYVLQQDGSLHKTYHDTKTERVLATFPNASALGLKFRYLKLREGDCLIYSKRSLHKSDPRPYWKDPSVQIDRNAANVRAFVGPRVRHAGTFEFVPGHPFGQGGKNRPPGMCVSHPRSRDLWVASLACPPHPQYASRAPEVLLNRSRALQ